MGQQKRVWHLLQCLGGLRVLLNPWVVVRCKVCVVIKEEHLDPREVDQDQKKGRKGHAHIKSDIKHVKNSEEEESQACATHVAVLVLLLCPAFRQLVLHRVWTRIRLHRVTS